MNASSIVELIKSGAAMGEEQVDTMVYDSDQSNHKVFFGGLTNVSNAVATIAEAFVQKYLNNPDTSAVPIRRKTKFLLVLNNIALDRKCREPILAALGEMDNIFEESMKKEGTMPFDSELGRMSEHMLVLLMRVTNYKFKAAQVLEFAENNTQFAVQLLLAILLKEPPYELELRVNCISGLLGFTMPHAFFNATDKIEETACGKFNEKVDFIANLMLRLSAIQVVNDVLTPHILNCTGGAVPPLLHIGATHMMRCAMNIFHFASTGATKWRQHILVSTSFVDGASILYLQAQVRHLESMFTPEGVPKGSVGDDVLGGIATALKFMAFATFHMGKYGRCMRPLCHFAHELAEIAGFVSLLKPGAPGAALAASCVVNWLHFLCNIDALAGDDEIIAEEGPEALSEELTSAGLTAAVSRVLTAVQAVGGSALDVIKNKFSQVQAGSLVSSDVASFSKIQNLITEAAAPAAAAAPAPAKAKPAEESPTTPPVAAAAAAPAPAKPKVSVEDAADVTVEHNFGSVTTAPVQTGANRFLCALNGHTMKNPVTSPHGHTFEKDVIEQWLRQKGNVCPFTGKPLMPSELQPNKELQNEIMQQVILQTMASSSYEQETDMYDF